MKRLWIDIETYSETDLLKHGVYRYTEDPAFRIILLAYAFDDGPVQCWSYEQPGGIPVIQVAEGWELWAHNAEFERVCFNRHFAHPPKGQWRCSAVLAHTLGFPPQLARLCETLKVPGKLDEGKDLLAKFAFGHKGGTPDYTDPDWELFKQYCMQDVEAARMCTKIMEKAPRDRF